MSKTPVSVLQELAVKKLESIPKYTFLSYNEGFKCKVECFGTEADGIGNNKKDAKQRAASNLLQSLDDVKCDYESASLDDEGNNLDHVNNYVGMLQEHCTKNSSNLPRYELVGDVTVGPVRTFTLKCTLGSLSGEGTGTSKKSAKHNAAMYVWNKLMNNDAASMWNKLEKCESLESGPIEKCTSVQNSLSTDEKKFTPISPYKSDISVPKNVFDNNNNSKEEFTRKKMSVKVEDGIYKKAERENCITTPNLHERLLKIIIDDRSNDSNILDSDDE